MRYFESETVELKSMLNKDLIKEIVAMLNTKGGNIYIGINDDDTICGLENPKSIIEDISNKINDTISPSSSFMISFSVIQEDNKNIIKIEIVKGNNPPYFIKSKGLNENGVFVRLGNTSRPATVDEIKDMIIQSKNITFESNISIEQNLKFEYFRNVLERNNIELNDNIQFTLGLKNSAGKYTNLALILSDNCPFTIKIALYKDTTLDSFYDRKEFTGSILKQINMVLEYVSLVNKVSGEILDTDRIDKPEYPMQALREAIINSIVHKDYSINSSTLIHIFTDRMQISSIGGIYGNISLESILKGGISITRNPKLQTILLRLKKVESLGTGISRIMKSYENNVIKPKIEITDSTFTMLIPKLSYKTVDEQIIINYLNNNETITREEFEKILGISKTNAINKIRIMLKNKVITQIGKGRNIKYILNK